MSQPPLASPRALAPRSRGVAVVAVLVFFTLMALAGRYGVFRDELYYVACGRRLAFGYVDHPPLVALMARLETALLGESLYALRFLPSLLAAGAVLVTGELARQLGGGRYAQLFAAVCVAAAPVFLGTAHILSMNVVLPVAWTACALLVVRALVLGEERAWIAFGLVAGVALLAKHSTLFFGAALTAGILATPHRRALAARGPWIGLAIAALLLAPNLAWEQAHGWPTLEFMRNAQEKKMVAMSPAAFLGAEVVDMLPLNLPVWIAGLGWLFVAERARPFRFLGVAFVVVTAIVLVGNGKPYYLAPAFPIPLAAGAVAIEGWIASRAARVAMPALVLVAGAAIAPLALPILDPPAFIAYARAIRVGHADDEKHAHGPLPQFLADQFGWEAMARKVAAAYAGLSPDEQRVAAFYASNYGEAGAIEFFAPRFGLPPAVSGHNSYFLWGPPKDGRGAVLISIGPDKEDLLEVYEEVEQVGETDEPYAMPYENHRPIFVSRKPRRPLTAVWPETKHFI